MVAYVTFVAESNFEEKMMDFLIKKFWGNDILDWLIAIGVVVICYIVAKILLWFTRNIVSKFTEKTKTQLDDILIDKLEEPIAVAVVIGGILWAVNFLHVPNPALDRFFHKFIVFAFVIDITWMIARVLDSLIEVYIVPRAEQSASTFDDQLVPILKKGAAATIWILGTVLALDNLDVDIGAMIAGLGIGGLALALAAQDAVKNVFGGIMIFLDKPFKIRDRIQIHGYDGTVEEVGLRSTRIRTLEGRQLIMPNSVFNDNEVINVTSEPLRKIKLVLGLTYDTTPDQMQLAIDTLVEIKEKHKDMLGEDHYIGFDSFGDFSLGITFIYFIQPDLDFLKVQSIMNLDILNRFNDLGLDFAFPTQTILKKELE